MIINVLLIVVGVALVLFGADKLTEGASALARRLNVPEIIIGLTIVAAGTSAPELFVSLVSALNGTPDMAVGNVVGSNTMNAMLIVGTAALVAPMVISPSTVKKDIPCSVLASILLAVLAFDGFLGRFDGIVLLLGFAAFMAYTLVQSKAGKDDVVKESSPVWKNILFIVFGLAGLVVGSNLFVDSASDVALSLGISEAVVGLTIVAGGTSLPELATSVVAARKGQSAIAIGNVIGSNVFNRYGSDALVRHSSLAFLSHPLYRRALGGRTASSYLYRLSSVAHHEPLTDYILYINLLDGDLDLLQVLVCT